MAAGVAPKPAAFYYPTMGVSAALGHARCAQHASHSMSELALDLFPPASNVKHTYIHGSAETVHPRLILLVTHLPRCSQALHLINQHKHQGVRLLQELTDLGEQAGDLQLRSAGSAEQRMNG